MKSRIAAVAFAFVLSALPVAQGQSPQPTEAAAAFQAGDYTRAAEAYAEWVEANPGDGLAWHRLGYALHALGRYEEALAAHVKAASFPQGGPTSAYNAACASALLGRADDAFTWLDKAVAAGFTNFALLASDKDFDGLRADERMRKYLPGGGSAGSIFQEPTRVVHDILGESAGDTFGWIARNLGDVDGDGVRDFVTSAPYKAIGGPMAGRVYVYSGKTGRKLFSHDGAPGDYLGAGIEAAGDADGDGVPDVLVGAPRWKGGAGEAFVLSGKNGEKLRTMTAGEQGDRFGNHVMGVGDLNGDGCGELLIGAPWSAPAAGAKAGRAYLYSGRDGELLAELEGERAGDQFGSTVGGAHGMFLVGAPQAGEGQRGRVYAYRFEDGAPQLAFTVDSDRTCVQLGAMFVSVVGDVNGDGTHDVYSSDWQSAGATGRVLVNSGTDGALLHDLRGETAGDGFGIGTAEAGDVNGDGCDDLVIGAWQSRAGGAQSAGRTYLYSGKTGELLRTWTCTLAAETFGFDATGLGDVDGDGAIDFLITSAQSNVAGKSAGRVLILAGEPPAAKEAGASDG